MKKDELVYVGHMLDTARKAIEFVQGVYRTDYYDNELLRIALTHLVQTIGESARRLSPAFRAKHPDLPWNKMVGMRHKVVHDYMEVDEDIVWDTVTKDLPTLIPQLEALLPDEPRQE